MALFDQFLPPAIGAIAYAYFECTAPGYSDLRPKESYISDLVGLSNEEIKKRIKRQFGKCMLYLSKGVFPTWHAYYNYLLYIFEYPRNICIPEEGYARYLTRRRPEYPHPRIDKFDLIFSDDKLLYSDGMFIQQFSIRDRTIS